MGESEKPDTAPEINKQLNIIVVIILIIAFVLLGLLLLINRDRILGNKQAADSETIVDNVEKGQVEPVEDTGDKMIEEEKIPEEDSSDEEIVVIPVERYTDLYVSNYEFEDEPEVNVLVEAQVKITNQGDATAFDFHWQWWPDDEEPECDEKIERLDAGETVMVECDYTFDSVDTYTTLVVVDSEEEVDESDEDNNIFQMQVTPIPEQIADLYIKDYEFSDTPEKNVPFDAIITIENQGAVGAEDFWWEWWPTAYDYDCREQIDELEAGEEVTVKCEDYVYAGWSNYKTQAKVDTDDDVEESDEDNNEAVEYVVPIH
jgi:subtilase family serine protease